MKGCKKYEDVYIKVSDDITNSGYLSGKLDTRILNDGHGILMCHWNCCVIHELNSCSRGWHLFIVICQMR